MRNNRGPSTNAKKPLKATRRIVGLLAGVFLTSALSACSSIGSATVERDRIDYESAIADSWKQQTLLNIVKIRYGDFPVFLEVAQVIAGYQLESTVAAGFNATGASGGDGQPLYHRRLSARPGQIHRPSDGGLRPPDGQ